MIANVLYIYIQTGGHIFALRRNILLWVVSFLLLDIWRNPPASTDRPSGLFELITNFCSYYFFKHLVAASVFAKYNYSDQVKEDEMARHVARMGD
jgi:hypothetical protein